MAHTHCCTVGPPRARAVLRPEQLPAPARAEEVERAPEELHLSRRHRPPVDLGLHAEAVDDDRLLRAELAEAARAVAVADAALLPAAHRHLGDRVVDERSEERRVGKEWSARR